jgi:hypothetical protein
VALGRAADGPASPILAKLRTRLRTEFGALVLDAREAPRDVVGLSAWVVDAEPELAGLPETAWGLLDGLAGGADGGLAIACTEWEGWCVFACGRRADLLARAVRRRLAAGSARSPGSVELMRARERAQAAGAGDYVIGIVVDAERFGALAESDRAALRALVGASEAAEAPRVVAVAGLRRNGELALEGRVLY